MDRFTTMVQKSNDEHRALQQRIHELEAFQAQSSSREAALIESQQEVSTLKTRLLEKDAELADKDAQLDDKAAIERELRADVEDRDAQVESLEARLRASEATAQASLSAKGVLHESTSSSSSSAPDAEEKSKEQTGTHMHMHMSWSASAWKFCGFLDILLKSQNTNVRAAQASLLAKGSHHESSSSSSSSAPVAEEKSKEQMGTHMHVMVSFCLETLWLLYILSLRIQV